MGIYHRENAQEDFLVLAGECLLIVEGEERKLNTWDFFHCPRDGAHHRRRREGARGRAGRRRARPAPKGLVYPVSETALKHDAGVKKETSDASEAYGSFAAWKRSLYQDGWLPDL